MLLRLCGEGRLIHAKLWTSWRNVNFQLLITLTRWAPRLTKQSASNPPSSLLLHSLHCCSHILHCMGSTCRPGSIISDEVTLISTSNQFICRSTNHWFLTAGEGLRSVEGKLINGALAAVIPCLFCQHAERLGCSGRSTWLYSIFLLSYATPSPCQFRAILRKFSHGANSGSAPN